MAVGKTEWVGQVRDDDPVCCPGPVVLCVLDVEHSGGQDEFVLGSAVGPSIIILFPSADGLFLFLFGMTATLGRTHPSRSA